MAEIAVELERAIGERAVSGTPGRAAAHLLAQGDGWTVEDVICTSGPDDRPFEEQHNRVAIAIVMAGTFQYRGAAARAGRSRELMTPGSLLLGSLGQRFECGHEHGTGDRCLSFAYRPDFFERLAADAGAGSRRTGFGLLRVPPLPVLSALTARACARLSGTAGVPWDELSLRLAAQTVRLVEGLPPRDAGAPPGAEARVTRIVRRIEREPEGPLPLASLAHDAGLSPYHFLRTFERVTGLTPHQYVRRTRLRAAATRLLSERASILDIALDSGFGDVSNFNRAFRTEFGVSPRRFRHAGAR